MLWRYEHGPPCLEVRFSNGPQTKAGLVFGTDAACDIVLPKLPGISKPHFALTYKNEFPDRRYRLIVRDLASKYGTKVTYDGMGDELRSDFDWIIVRFKIPNDAKAIILQPVKGPRFQLSVVRYDITSPEYTANIERFRQGAAGTKDLLDGIELEGGPAT